MTRSRRQDLSKFIGVQDKMSSLSYRIDRTLRERSRPELLLAELGGQRIRCWRVRDHATPGQCSQATYYSVPKGTARKKLIFLHRDQSQARKDPMAQIKIEDETVMIRPSGAEKFGALQRRSTLSSFGS